MLKGVNAVICEFSLLKHFHFVQNEKFFTQKLIVSNGTCLIRTKIVTVTLVNTASHYYW